MQNLEDDIKKHCRFCNPPDKERILFESKNFYVMLSLGPIVEGYVLIISKAHFESCGSIPENLGDEFDFLVSQVKSILNRAYDGCVLYEHGRAGSCLSFSESSKHCYHAHMHLVPINLKINDRIEGTLTPINLTSFKEFRKICKSYNEPYLFVEDGDMKIHIVVHDIRRQYLRFIVSKQIGDENLWDWVKFQGWEKIKSAKIKLTPYFEKLKTEYGI